MEVGTTVPREHHSTIVVSIASLQRPYCHCCNNNDNDVVIVVVFIFLLSQTLLGDDLRRQSIDLEFVVLLESLPCPFDVSCFIAIFCASFFVLLFEVSVVFTTLHFEKAAKVTIFSRSSVLLSKHGFKVSKKV